MFRSSHFNFRPFICLFSPIFHRRLPFHSQPPFPSILPVIWPLPLNNPPSPSPFPTNLQPQINSLTNPPLPLFFFLGKQDLLGVDCIRIIWPTDAARPWPLDPPFTGDPPYPDWPMGSRRNRPPYEGGDEDYNDNGGE